MDESRQYLKTRRRVLASLAFFAYPAWLAMMAVHESDHVLHAWLSGGSVQRVTVPLWGFSYTELAANPHPLFVAWGGLLWGCAIPLLAAAIATIVRRPTMAGRGLHLFAGFCLIANGAYLAVGQADAVGDAGDLIRHGVPRWALIVIGGIAIAGGLLLWHRLGRQARRSG